MEHYPVQDNRRSRLGQLSAEWGVAEQSPPVSPLPRPEARSFRTDNDELYAEELLKRQRMAESQNGGSKGGLTRAFTTKKKAWEYREVFAALMSHVASQGAPGVAEALIAKLNLVGGNLNLAQKSRTSLLTRRKSLDLGERSQVLQIAVQNGHLEMVEVLLPYADALSLDTALPVAIRNRNIPVLELLIRYGASAVQTADGQDAFRQACVVGGQADIIALIVSSEGRPSTSWQSQSMVDAARAGCLRTVALLSQSTADGNYDDGAALKVAVGLGRRDIALAILLGSKPPAKHGLNEAFGLLAAHQNINPNEKMAMAEILLCAGADGDTVAQALVVASATDFLEMVHLLVTYGASVEYEDAIVVRKAVSKGKVDLVNVLLSGKSTFSPTHASGCVQLLPKKLRFEERHALLTALLCKGAHGPSLDDALVDVAEAGDMESAKLLLSPFFPGDKTTGNQDFQRVPRSMAFERHEIASTDHKGGLALQIAVKRSDRLMVGAILAHKPPSPEVLAQIFPSTRNLARADRYHVTELFLKAGLVGPGVHTALENAIEEQPPNRDEKLIQLLLRYNADVNFNDGHGITAAIAQKDSALLERLLNGNPTAQVTSKAIPKAMEIDDEALRLRMVTMLLLAGAAEGVNEVSTALLATIQARPTDKQLLQVLLEQGKADVNLTGGSAVIHAMQHPDPVILNLILELGKPDTESLAVGLRALAQLPSSPDKASKLMATLERTKPKDIISGLVIEEVKILLKADPSDRDFNSLKILLANGADINAKNSEALGRAVAAADMQIVDVLFSARPNPNSLAFAMPHALRIRDPMDRMEFAQRILEGGIPASEVNRALVFAVKTHADDMPLVNALLARADTQDGQALIEAIKNENCDIVDLILRYKSFSVAILNTGFAHAARWKDKRSRSASCSSLLEAGASGDVVSEALVAAATDRDLDFGTILLRNGANVEHRDGQAIVEACRSGAVDVLEMLLASSEKPGSGEDEKGNKAGKVSQQTLQKGFQAATEVGDLNRRADIFRLLLDAGVSGEVVDAQLVSAVRFGDSGQELLRLLLAHGASPDYNDGEAVDKATRSAFLGNLGMLLAIVNVGGRQMRPSSLTLGRAIDACWDLSRDTRFTVMEWVFMAGRPAPGALHQALNRVVKEEDPEERLVELLVSNRASPVANGCQTLIDAARTLPAPAFAQLLGAKISASDASLVFESVYNPQDVNAWLSKRGYEIAEHLLEQGAAGGSVNMALAAVLGADTASSDDVASDFLELLLVHGADVNDHHGKVLQNAASQGRADLLRRLLDAKPNVESLTLAFPRIFEAGVGEDALCELIMLFTDHKDGQNQLDVMFVHPGAEPVIIRALSEFPRSTRILQALLDVGFYHEQTVTCKVLPELDEDEPATLLLWALLQPQKKISSAVINLLIDRGAKVNFETRVSHVTPLMVAIQHRRQDLVKSLLLAGAEVDVQDATGRSPLSMASNIGGELGVVMMGNLLAAGASRNDGSLHNAARELNLQAMQVLVEHGHDPDFPSPLHDGRSALGELCLHSADLGEITATREKQMEKAINFLVESGSDIALQSDGKSILLLAMESADPVTTTKVLLRAYMWKYINKPFNLYTDGKFTYSPTMYVERVLPESDQKPQLQTLLRANRGTDTYYANTGPQPDDAKGMPVHLELEEQERRARAARLKTEQEDHARAMQRTRELAAVQEQIRTDQAELEEARQKRALSSDLNAQRERRRADEEAFNAAMRRQRQRQSADLAHQEALASAAAARARVAADAELAADTARHARRLEWEREVTGERVGSAAQLSSLRLREREELDRLDRAADARVQERIREQRRLVDSQSALAANLTAGGGGGTPLNRRQIGFITGEVGPNQN